MAGRVSRALAHKEADPLVTEGRVQRLTMLEVWKYRFRGRRWEKCSSTDPQHFLLGSKGA